EQIAYVAKHRAAHLVHARKLGTQRLFPSPPVLVLGCSPSSLSDRHRHGLRPCPVSHPASLSQPDPFSPPILSPHT
uniref:Uncharacterized protein n=1 Tax=Aegilops tauschii subsp. strangulata TaxID=200361 RepID=A0A453S1M0_AEGTS